MDKSVYVPSTWKRLIAQGLDQCFRLPLYWPFAKVLFLLVFTDEDVFLGLGEIIWILCVPFIYSGVFLWLLQATPGKWLMGLKVVPAEDPEAALQWQQCVLRPLVERLSLFVSWMPYALAFFRYDRTHLADWVAETRVVQFTPRPSRPPIRWFVGTLLCLLYIYEGLVSAVAFNRALNWETRRLDVRDLIVIEEED
ncbi:MAG: RDD family protein [Bdellovibrio sp.]